MLLQHAIRLFADRGYDGVSTRDLAKAADTTEVSLYRLFQTKENLYVEAVNDVEVRSKQRVAEVVSAAIRDGRGDLRRQISGTVRGWYTSLPQCDARLLQQVLKQVYSCDRKLRKQACAAIAEIIGLVSGQLRAQLSAKESELNADLLIWALFELKILQASAQPSKDEMDKVDTLIEHWLNLILPTK